MSTSTIRVMEDNAVLPSSFVMPIEFSEGACIYRYPVSLNAPVHESSATSIGIEHFYGQSRDPDKPLYVAVDLSAPPFSVGQSVSFIAPLPPHFTIIHRLTKEIHVPHADEIFKIEGMQYLTNPILIGQNTISVMGWMILIKLEDIAEKVWVRAVYFKNAQPNLQVCSDNGDLHQKGGLILQTEFDQAELSKAS